MMRVYLIYLIEDEFAEYFYGRENKFVELFIAQSKEKGALQTVVQKQIQYITKPLPYLELHKHLSHFVQRKEFYIKGKVYCVRTNSDEERSEEHTSELQSREKLVCRLLLEKTTQSGDHHRH